MPGDTEWSKDYDTRTLECTAARIAVALEPSPRVWPISGAATEFNPSGHPLSEPTPAPVRRGPGAIKEDA